MGASRLIGPPRHARPLALASAVATLLGALFLCLGVGDPGGADRFAGHETAARHHTSVVDEFVCPYDPGGCSLFPSLSPAVLSAPPPATPLHAEGRPPRPGAPPHSGQAPRPGAQPRAPDLHVLQVLRT
ncbi:hypothetical protein [Streptomyces showdoensis]|uniref:Uncharacterized protein n=1 Tax=Streptomyces showdoensis TaxID=68268 RepID=A0A2P2GIZ0_STREW|nr:hypothetical protein [Streptomyces showdoensis]KKZ71463.1 hypothetical protein VO63_23265 [Streptomyces showdoensis]